MAMDNMHCAEPLQPRAHARAHTHTHAHARAHTHTHTHSEPGFHGVPLVFESLHRRCSRRCVPTSASTCACGCACAWARVHAYMRVRVCVRVCACLCMCDHSHMRSAFLRSSSTLKYVRRCRVPGRCRVQPWVHSAEHGALRRQPHLQTQ